MAHTDISLLGVKVHAQADLSQFHTDGGGVLGAILGTIGVSLALLCCCTGAICCALVYVCIRQVHQWQRYRSYEPVFVSSLNPA